MGEQTHKKNNAKYQDLKPFGLLLLTVAIVVSGSALIAGPVMADESEAEADEIQEQIGTDQVENEIDSITDEESAVEDEVRETDPAEPIDPESGFEAGGWSDRLTWPVIGLAISLLLILSGLAVIFYGLRSRE